MEERGMAAYSVFHIQSSSFLKHQQKVAILNIDKKKIHSIACIGRNGWHTPSALTI
ncbi:MAG: hypothetical protein NEHIOOID_00291 [Holosporales bacterium]